MWAYAYYVEDEPLTSDWQFDNLAKWLLKHWDTLPPHPHKHLISTDDLRAGTYLGQYPEIVKVCVNQYRKGALSD
jgi:NAD-dependent DNA ligase